MHPGRRPVKTPAYDRRVESESRVVTFAEFGGPEVLRIETRPVPEPGPGQVRVRMAYAGLNPVDYKIRRGGDRYDPVLPSGVGRELSGIVEATGPEVERLAAGDVVFGSIPDGAIADHVLAPEANLAFVPDELSLDVAGALALAGQTAWDAIASQGIRRGDTILVSAAAGGVGGILAQLGVHAGARVIGSASPGNHEWLRARGVEPVAYGSEFVADVRALLDGAPATAAFDLHGEESVRQFLELGVPAERINTNAMGGVGPAGVRHVGRGAADVDTLGTLAAFVVDGVLEVPIARRYRLEQVREAFAFLEERHLRGKVVVGDSDFS